MSSSSHDVRERRRERLELAVDAADADPPLLPQHVGAEQAQHDEQRERVPQRQARAQRQHRHGAAAPDHELIALAAPRADQRLGSGAIELAPQPLHVDVDDVRQRIVVLVPDVLGDVRAADDVARAADEVFEEGVFLGGEQHVGVADAHLAAARVDRERADRQPLGQQRLPPAADERAQPREQLAEVERLHQVVVGAAVQPFDARLHGVARGHHEDRHRAARFADRAADGEAVAHRQHDVEDHRVVVGGADLEDGGVAVAGDVHGVGLLAQPFGQHMSCGVVRLRPAGRASQKLWERPITTAA